MKSIAHYIVRARPPRGISAAKRALLSQLLVRGAEKFGYSGMLDWQVTLNSRDRSELSIATEFRNLEGRADKNQAMEIYFPKLPLAKAYQQTMAQILPDVSFGKIAKQVQKDWMRAWRRHYKPVRISASPGRKKRSSGNDCSIWIVPAWQKPPAHAVAIKIHPGQAFGTGTHPTTALCLRAFLDLAPAFAQAAIQPKMKFSILDFGAGTGILAIAAHAYFSSAFAPLRLAPKQKKWAYGSANIKPGKLHATEIDPVAAAQLKKNARLNRTPLHLLSDKKLKQQLLKSGKYHLVFANVLSPVLLAEKATLHAALLPDAYLVLSGILAKDRKAFLQEFLRGSPLKLKRTYLDKGWCALVLT